MEPTRSTMIGEWRIREYYWAGSYPCYVNARLVKHSWDEACDKLNKGEQLEWAM